MLDTIESNLKKLIAAYESQRDRADRAEKELERCKDELAVAKDEIKQQEETIDSLKMRTMFAPSEGGNSEAKAGIDRLIAQIDKALELLQ